jgi:hypothetical protein
MYVLYNVNIITDDDGLYQLIPDKDSMLNGAKQFAIKANPLMLKRFLKRCGSTDDLILPRSKRSLTYDEIITNILNGSNTMIHIFGHRYPKSLEDLNNGML